MLVYLLFITLHTGPCGQECELEGAAYSDFPAARDESWSSMPAETFPRISSPALCHLSL